MAKEKTDRRIRKTRALLQQALVQLMSEKEIKDISVKELTDLADLNRGTFYLHYADIYDMLYKMEDEIFEEFHQILNRNMEGEQPIDSHKAILLEIFRFLDERQDMARMMTGPHGDLTFVNRLKDLVAQHLSHLMAHCAEDYEYYNSFLVSGFVGVIETWLNTPNPLPPEKMAELCSRMQGFILALPGEQENLTDCMP